jgi:hypothetical protein
MLFFRSEASMMSVTPAVPAKQKKEFPIHHTSLRYWRFKPYS